VYREKFSDPTNCLFLSAISFQEIAIKYQLGKIILPSPPDQFLPESCEKLLVVPLPFFPEAALLLASLPSHHRDPFDRALVCQAMFHQMPFASSDPVLQQYPVTMF
jgi:PIN domain nuclease of toxin-antitoxin system